MTENAATESTSTEAGSSDLQAADSPSGPEAGEASETLANGSETTEPDTFSRAYVQELRTEAAKHRTNSKRSDELARRLVTALTDATGRLHDARDLAFREDLLTDGLPDPAKVNEAVEALIKERPHLARIRPFGDVGQGVTSDGSKSDLTAFGDMLREAAS